MTHFKLPVTMTRLAVSLAAIISTGSIAAPTLASDGYYTVPLNKNEMVRLPAPASAVIIGDPNIADVSIHSSDIILVIGRSFGETNLIVLDEAGQTIMNTDIQVVGSNPRGRVRVFNVGEGRETYSCTPECLPAPVLGDGSEFFGAFSPTGGTISNTVANGPTASSAPSALTGAFSPPPPSQ